MNTDERGYTDRLLALEPRWKKWLCVQLPYRLHLRGLKLGKVLDVGCGIGRNLLNLEGSGVGVDHNPDSVAVAVSRGLIAYTPAGFRASEHALKGSFDSMLVSHVLEHMRRDEAASLLKEYLPWIRGGGRVVMIAPQENGYRSDPSHVEFADFEALAAIARETGIRVEKSYSFPFPRSFGRFFRHNEFVVIARKP
jgi:SAM-dependent methyltransferase